MSRGGWTLCRRILTVLPPLFLIYWVLKYKVRVPQSDDWGFIRLIEKSYQGTLTFRDLWAQHGAQRQFFPKALLIFCVHWTHWDVTFLLLLNVTLAVGTFAVLAYQLRAASKSVGDPEILWLLPILSVFLFSASQYENWSWEGRVGKLLALWSIITALVVLATPPFFHWAKVHWAWMLGVLATYSYSTGLVLWPLGAWVLSNNSFRDAAEKRRALSLWTVYGGIVILLYFYKFHSPPGFETHRVSLLEQPSAYLWYVLSYLGTPLWSHHLLGAVWASLFGLGVFAVMCRELRRQRSGTFQVLVFYVSLGLFSIGSALLTGVGRVGYGIEQAMSSRYIAFAQFLWIADLVFLYLVFQGKILPDRRLLSGLAGIAFAGISLLAVCNSAVAIDYFRQNHRRLSSIREQILAPSREEDFYRKMLPIKKTTLENGIVILRKRHLSVFAETTESSRHGIIHSPSRSQ